MGQYYKVYVSNDEGHKAFCPQNAVYMTKNGIEDSTKIGMHSWDTEDPNSWGYNFSGLKLMEHSWLDNDFVNGVLEAIWDSPSRIAWVGDYADDIYDFDEYYTEQVYGAAWGEDEEPELPFDKVPTIHESGFIVNHDKGVYIDLACHARVAGFRPTWGNGSVWTIHPLPILTAIGNGRGGGDYEGTLMDKVGTWAMDTISYTKERPRSMDEAIEMFMEV